MSRLRSYILLFCGVFAFQTVPVMGQISSSAPEIEFPGPVYITLPELLFPSAWDELYPKYSGSFNYEGFGGVRKNLRTIRAHGKFSPSKDLDKSNALGFIASSNYSGPYLTKSRFMGHMQKTIHLSPKALATAGAHIGIYSILIKDNPSGVTGSELSPDGNFGVNVVTDKIMLGATIHQLFNNEIRPITISGSLKRHYSLRGSYLFKLSNDIRLLTGGWFRILDFYENELYLHTRLLYNQYGYTLMYTTQGQISNILSFDHGKSLNRWKFSLAFHLSLRPTVVNRFGSFQLGVGYRLLRDGSQFEK